jgi:hypothetical protein
MKSVGESQTMLQEFNIHADMVVSQGLIWRVLVLFTTSNEGVLLSVVTCRTLVTTQPHSCTRGADTEAVLNRAAVLGGANMHLMSP